MLYKEEELVVKRGMHACQSIIPRLIVVSNFKLLTKKTVRRHETGRGLLICDASDIAILITFACRCSIVRCTQALWKN